MCNTNDILNFETNLNLPREVRLGAKKIVYTYDAAGTKLRKVAYDNSGVLISRTEYVGGIQYESLQPLASLPLATDLKFMMTSEGRVVKNAGVWQYEYFHKDHLGNSRVVYGYQKQVDEFKATMETQFSTKEQSQFYNLPTTRVTAFNRTPASIDVVTPDKSAETNGNLAGKAIGPAKMLQVTAGDRLQLEVFARYSTGTGTNNTLITNLASAVTTTFQTVSGEAAFTALTNNVPVQAATITKASTVPKAYLFYILFNSSYVYQQFGFVQVSSAALAAHQQLYLDITIPTGGYLYTYVANESNVSASTSVYFDDFNIIHTRNTNTLQVVQTTDYYPFGLAMAAQSYQKQSSLDNDYLYNGKELQDEHNLGWMDYGARMYIPEIGRWGTVDPLADEPEQIDKNVYTAFWNNPVKYDDPDGRCPNCATAGIGAVVGGLIGGGIEIASQLYDNGSVNNWSAVGGSVLQGAVTGAAAGFTGGASLLTTAAVTGGANAVGGTLNRKIQGQSTNVGDVLIDAAVGGALGAGGKVIGSAVGNATNNMSNSAKGKLGEAITKLKYNAQGYVRTGYDEVLTGSKTATGKDAKAVFDHKMKNVITGKGITVESKFNKSGFTENQRAVVRQGYKVTLDRTTSNGLGKAAQATTVRIGAGIAPQINKKP